MAKKNAEKAEQKQSIQATLLSLARPRMTPKELLKAARRQHPEASKKDIVRAAFHSIIAVADSDVDTALLLQDFAIRQRGGDDT